MTRSIAVWTGLLEHKAALFAHLRGRWSDLFGAQFDVLLYDLTSTCFECDVPEDEQDPRRFGHSRDKRWDCVQVVVAQNGKAVETASPFLTGLPPG